MVSASKLSHVSPAPATGTGVSLSQKDPTDDQDFAGTKWKDMTSREKTKRILINSLKVIGLIVLLYLFICLLGILASAFRLLGGRTAGEVFSNNELLRNPVVGLTIGILATVLLQSSSTTTSILVSMVAAEIVTVKVGIPIVMGANIGTSMTNTLISIAHSGDREEFKRAFAGATVHDMFNCLCVIILLPLEAISGYLYRLSTAIVDSLDLKDSITKKPPKLLKAITGPFTKLIIQLDKGVIKDIAKGNIGSNETVTLIKHCCKTKSLSPLNDSLCMAENLKRCKHIFAGTSLSDSIVGLILLIVSLIGICLCLMIIVRTLHSMLSGSVARMLKKTINNDIPNCSYLTGYLFIVMGMLLTILLQSSSVFTSALTPLVGVGVLNLDRMYPLTLGSNIGTTFTAILAALATSGKALRSTLQIALCHLFFNITGIALFYPIPFTRKAPIGLAQILGNTTAKYRWFVILYLMFMFFIIPAFVFALSLAGFYVMIGVLVPIAVFIIVIIVVNILQVKFPQILPQFLKDWSFLPLWAHSLRPLDTWISKGLGIFYKCCPQKCCNIAKILPKPQDNYDASPLETVSNGRISTGQRQNTDHAYDTTM